MGNSAEEIKISVLIPVYNVDKYLSECVQSVIGQSIPVYEIILVDDGSTDRSGVICDELAAKHEHVRVFHKPNQGLISARRYAIERASGNWLIFLDSDDSLKDQTIETIHNAIGKYSPDCIIYGMDRVREGKVIEAFQPELTDETLITDKGELYELVFTHSTLNPLWRKAIRANLTSDDYSGFWNISLAEDLLQSIEIYEKGKSFLFLSKPLYNYRYNASSMSNTINVNSYKTDFTVREKVLEFLTSQSAFNEEQWQRYQNYALQVFVQQIKTVLTFRTTSKEIRALLNEIRETNYYASFISSLDFKEFQKLDAIIWTGFKKKRYAVLLLLNKLYRLKKWRVQ